MEASQDDFAVLIVDDIETNIEVVAAFLDEEGLSHRGVSNGKAALEELFTYHYDLVLLDINMPVMDGWETIRRLKSDTQTKDIPIIFLSAQDDVESITRAFEAGAVDYVSKPFNGAELIARVKTHLKMQQYMREIEDKQNRLAQLVATDQVTRVANRLRLISELRQNVAFAEAGQGTFTIILLSVNNLSRYHEMYGFEAGDKLLLRLATKVKEAVNAPMLFGRLYGGDFLILMPEHTKAAGVHLANKLVKLVIAEKVANVAVSCTAVVEEFKEGDTDVLIIRRAEEKLKKARQMGLSVLE